MQKYTEYFEAYSFLSKLLRKEREKSTSNTYANVNNYYTHASIKLQKEQNKNYSD